MTFQAVFSTLLTMGYCYLYLFPWLSKRCFQLFSQWGIVICICFHDFPSGVFNSSHNGVLLFVSVSMTFQAVFSTLLTMGYCYLYLFPWLSKRCFLLFSQWSIVICICFHDFPSGVFNSSHNGVLLFVSVSMTFQAVFSTLLTMGSCYLYLFQWLSKRCFQLFSQWGIVICICFHDFQSSVFNSSHNGVLLFVSVSMTFQAVFSTLLTMEYCYLYLFPWLSKRFFQLFSQWGIVICICFYEFPSGVFNSPHNGVLLFVSVSMTFQAVFSTLLTIEYCYLYLFPWLSKRCFQLFSQWSIVICICFHDFPSGVFNSSHNGVLLFVSVSMTFQAVFSTLLTMGYCYLYLFPWLSKQCFQLFSQWSIVICICFHDFPSSVFNSSHNGVLLFVSVSMNFQAVFSTLLTMGYCYLYLFPWLSKRCFQLFSQWGIVFVFHFVFHFIIIKVPLWILWLYYSW